MVGLHYLVDDKAEPSQIDRPKCNGPAAPATGLVGLGRVTGWAVHGQFCVKSKDWRHGAFMMTLP